MKKIYLLLVVIIVLLASFGAQIQLFSAKKDSPVHVEKANEEQIKSLSPARKILVVYFSHPSSTREIANQIHQNVGGDIVEIQTVDQYPTNYVALVMQAKLERESGYKPALKIKIKNIESYDLIFLGSPVWGGTIPQPIVAFLSEYDLSGKTLVPFCTHGGNGEGQSFTDITTLSPQSTVLEGFAIEGNNVKTAQPEIAKWLSKIKVIE